ncbi:MAG: YqaE/Pmp3 family membrane protein [Gammaproteobacteria bacterium]|nr:YqaE/Pmp3 family membrane protein [Gammaproteobacteria bacterium]
MERFLLTILALLLPPVAVFVKAGHHWQLYVNLFFCLVFYIPAVVHAVWFVRRKPRALLPEPEDIDYMDAGEQGSTQSPRVEPRLDW